MPTVTVDLASWQREQGRIVWMMARIVELEAALKPFSDAVYDDNGDVTISHAGQRDYMRAKRVLNSKT